MEQTDQIRKNYMFDALHPYKARSSATLVFKAGPSMMCSMHRPDHQGYTGIKGVLLK